MKRRFLKYRRLWWLTRIGWFMEVDDEGVVVEEAAGWF